MLSFDVVRSLRAVQDSSTQANQLNGCLIYDSFIWASKEMNIENRFHDHFIYAIRL